MLNRCVLGLKIDRFIKVYGGARYLVLLGSEKYYSILKRIRYLISVKSGVTKAVLYNY